MVQNILIAALVVASLVHTWTLRSVIKTLENLLKDL
jgi:hypothetical protein